MFLANADDATLKREITGKNASSFQYGGPFDSGFVA